MDFSKILDSVFPDASDVVNSADSLIENLTSNVLGNDAHSVASLFGDSPISWSSDALTNIDTIIDDLINLTGGTTQTVEPPPSEPTRTDGNLPGPGTVNIPWGNGVTTDTPTSTNGTDPGIYTGGIYTTDGPIDKTIPPVGSGATIHVSFMINGERFDLQGSNWMGQLSKILNAHGVNAEVAAGAGSVFLKINGESIDPTTPAGLNIINSSLGNGNIQFLGWGEDIYVPTLQQSANSCGPTSLAMYMSYYGDNVSNYESWFNTSDLGVDPLSLADIATYSYGMVARQVNHASLDDVAALIDQGLPVMVLGTWGEGGGSSGDYINMIEQAHYMVVTGYERDSSGNITNINLNDPSSGGSRTMTTAAFMQFWGREFIPGVTNYLMAFAPQGSADATCLLNVLPSDRVSSSVSNTLRMIQDAREMYEDANNFWDNPGQGISDIISDFTDLIGDGWNSFWDGVGDWISSWF